MLSIVGSFLLLCCGVGTFMTWESVQRARQAARVSVSRNNLKYIGLALHNYHDVNRTFPPSGIYGEDGAEYVSWQTSLLPYLERGPLYQAINKNVPWTDPVNAGYYSTSVPAYANPSIIGSPSNSQGLAVSHYAGNSQVFAPNRSISIVEIRDGMTNTVLAGEVAAGFKPWADPGNVRDPAAGLGMGGDTFSGASSAPGTQFLMGDGSVRVVTSDISPEVLEAIATPAGQESVPPF